MIPRLGVNIDHVATLRQARGEDYPSLVQAALTSIQAGADQITIHLREDRRHIQDQDVLDVRKVCLDENIPLNLELGANKQILELGIEQKVDWICFVPENRQERTTEGGLDLLNIANFEKLQSSIKLCKRNNIKVSLFVEAHLETLKKCAELEADAVEIHTGDYAKAFLEKKDLAPYLEKYSQCCEFINSNKISYHAGHGLTLESVLPLLEQGIFTEYNIGHWIISESIFKGLNNVVSELKQKFISRG